MTQPIPRYVTDVPSHTAIHNRPPRSFQLQNLSQDQLRSLREKLLESFLQLVVQAVRGLFIPGGGIGSALDQLREWADGISLEGGIQAVKDLLTGIADATDNEFDDWLIGLLTSDSPLDGRNIFNLLIPVGSIVETYPNTLLGAGFDDTDTVEANPLWFWDGTTGDTLPGSVRVAADGIYSSIRSIDLEVVVGQKMQFTAKTRWDSLVSTGASIQLKLTKFDENDVRLGEDTLDTITPGSGTLTLGTWQELDSGSYTVGAGVAMVQLRLVVTTGATAGTVHFDDAYAARTSFLQMAWVENLIKRWENVAALFGIVDTDLDGDVDVSDVIAQWINIIVNPLEVLQDVLARARGQGIIDRIFSGFNDLGEQYGLNLDSDEDTVLDSFVGIFRSVLQAHSNIASHDNRLLALETAPATIVDTFNRGAALNLGADWSIVYSEAGAGTLGTNGSGSTEWEGNGNLARTAIARNTTTAMPGDDCIIKFMLSIAPDPSGIFTPTPPDAYVVFRMNSANTIFTRLKMYQTSYGVGLVQLQFVNAGTITNIGSPVTLGYLTAIEWQLNVGIPSGEPRHFTLYKNGVLTGFDLEDTGDISTVGSSNRWTGLGKRATPSLAVQAIPGQFSVFSVQSV